MVLGAAIGITLIEVRIIARDTATMVRLRMPVALVSTELVSDLYSTLATLRGYLLTGNPQGKADRAAMWLALDRDLKSFDALAASLTDAQDKSAWTQIKSTIVEFRAAQDKAEALAFTPDAFPATKLLLSPKPPPVPTRSASS